MYEDALTISDLLFKIKLLKDRIAAFESGEKYLRMKEEHKKAREADARKMRQLEEEAEAAHRSVIRNRDLWYQTCLDIQKGCKKELRQQEIKHREEIKKKDAEIERLYGLLRESDERNEADHKKMLECTEKMYEAQAALEEERERNAALTTRIKKDYSNSSKSSSLSPNHKKIQNGREKTGRKPGGQPGHEHHGRKPKEPTSSVVIPAPREYLEDDNYKPTGRIIRKQLICFMVVPEVIEYTTPEFRDQTTGQRVHADFPPGIVDDVNYDGTVKAVAYMINNELYTSVEKTRVFLKQISHDTVDISAGFINGLSKEFSKKTAEEREKMFLKLASSEIMHSDFTFGRMDGKQTAVAICATGDTVLYQGRPRKGDEGVAGTPLEVFGGTLVSDHEASLIKHGSIHQECLSHVKRYALSSDENEPGKTWGLKTAEWIKRTVGWWDDVHGEKETYDAGRAEGFIEELREILRCAKDEYEYEPPSKYYKDGYNLYHRMEEDFDDYVLFLRDINVPPTNNLAERCARKFKRKAAQVMAFRSQAGVDYFCDGLSVMESLRAQGCNVFDEISQRFNQNLVAWHY